MYGGTKQEMERLLADATAISGITYDVSSYADVVGAIHVIQENLGIAGATALEAENTIGGSLNSLKSAFDNFIVGLGNADADMQQLIENLVDAFENVVKNIAPIIENIANSLPDAFGAMLPIIGDLLPDLLNTVANLFEQVLDMLLKTLPDLIPVAVNAVMIIVDTLVNNLPLLIDAAITLIMTLTDGLVDALPQLIPAVIAMIILLTTELIKRIPEILEFVPKLFTNLVQAFKEVDWASLGSDLMKGVVGGILNLKDWVVEKVKDVAGNIAQGFKDFFGIKSPSKLMAEYGKNIDEGLAEGIDNNAEVVYTTVNKIAENVSNTIDKIKENIGIQFGDVTYLGNNPNRGKEPTNYDGSWYDKSDLDKEDTSVGSIWTPLGSIKVGGVGVSGKEKREQYKAVEALQSEINSKYGKWYSYLTDSMSEDSAAGGKGTSIKDIFNDLTDEQKSLFKKKQDINQNITINSPIPLSPSETARQLKNASRELAMGV